QHIRGEPRLLLVEVDRDHLAANRCAVLEREQDVEERVAVYAAGQADHDTVTGLDQREVADGFADFPAQAFSELVGLELGLARVTRRHGDGGRNVESGGVHDESLFYRLPAAPCRRGTATGYRVTITRLP